MAQLAPKFKEEENLFSLGYQYVAGVDEVGRGAWAGPLIVAAVIFPSKRLYKVRDSKILSKEKRESLFLKIQKEALAYALGEVSNKEIDQLGLSTAIKKAAKKAIDSLKIKPDFCLLDGNWNYLKDFFPESKTIKKGDSLCFSIAAASIVAKVSRDKMMEELDPKHFLYDFKNNKGYPAKNHLKALGKYGPCKIHRFSYEPIKDLLNKK